MPILRARPRFDGGTGPGATVGNAGVAYLSDREATMAKAHHGCEAARSRHARQAKAQYQCGPAHPIGVTRVTGPHEPKLSRAPPSSTADRPNSVAPAHQTDRDTSHAAVRSGRPLVLMVVLKPVVSRRVFQSRPPMPEYP